MNIHLLLNAINILVPKAEVHINDDGSIQWINPSKAPVSDDKINKKYLELVEKSNKELYKIDRSKAYPSIQDQLDMLWHAIDRGITLDKDSEFYISLKRVKDLYPKTTV